MLLLHRPDRDEIRAFIADQAPLPFSYPEIGATRGDAPAGYRVAHHRTGLGRGQSVFERAAAALRDWRMFSLPGVELCWPDAPITVGTTVAILAGGGRLWSLNACRIVYVVDEDAAVSRMGFAYGTLPAHAVRGEERFLVEWSRASDEVSYDLMAFSRPRSWLLHLGLPLLRRVQGRFARGSLAAMRRATR
jgi:uncharacterized protein (UPF0548 family)